MSWDVEWEPAATNQVAGFLKSHPESVATIFDLCDMLEEDSAPPGSRAWGISHRRLRHGPWRILYRLDASRHTVHVEHIGHHEA